MATNNIFMAVLSSVLRAVCGRDRTRRQPEFPDVRLTSRDGALRRVSIALLLAVVSPAHGAVDTELLRQRVEELSATVEDPTLPKVQFAAPDVVQRFYQDRGFAPAWNDERAAALSRMVSDAEIHGLDPDDYLISELKALPPLATATGVARIDADLVLTESLLRYGYHRRFGKVDPRELDSSWNYARSFSAGGPYGALERILDARDLTAQVDKEVGNGPVYEALRTVLARYRHFVASGGWQPVSAGPALKAGMTDPRVAAVRSRLLAEGFEIAPTGDPNTFDEGLTVAVRAFQNRHGLNDDGAIGPRTLGEMNVSATDLVDRLRVNLERLRWVLVERTPRFVAANIAGFRVYYVEDDDVRWSARAMVGKPYRQTPIFRADMKYLVLNPDWTVPPGILRKDKLPTIRKDPTYLQRQNMDVVDAKGNIVDPATIDWSQPFRYMLKQRPGPTNALGRVKFMFPNSHFVFLHDTPSRELFAQETRTFSSGCIRVENPLELADIMLKKNGGWSIDKLQSVVDSGVTQTVSLKEPLPVLILYLTAIAFDEGRDFTFYRDVYGRDGAVLEALNAGFVYSAPDPGAT